MNMLLLQRTTGQDYSWYLPTCRLGGIPAHFSGRAGKYTFQEATIVMSGGVQVSANGPTPTPFCDPWKSNGASGDPLFQFNLIPRFDPPVWRREDSPNIVIKPMMEEIQARSADNILEEVYSLSVIGDLQGATDKVFDTFDGLLLEGDCAACNEILRKVDVSRLSTALMRSFLTITAAAKEKLPARKALYKQVLSEMIRLKGKEKAERLIGQLA
jgi:hypothetical protein